MENLKQFVCHLYDTPKQSAVGMDTRNITWIRYFRLRIHLVLQTVRSHYQAKIWPHTSQQQRHVSSAVDISVCIKESAIWRRLPPIPDARVELVKGVFKLKAISHALTEILTRMSNSGKLQHHENRSIANGFPP